eukprot:1443223-Pleurochrysis_carterae.AAC.1
MPSPAPPQHPSWPCAVAAQTPASTASRWTASRAWAPLAARRWCAPIQRGSRSPGFAWMRLAWRKAMRMTATCAYAILAHT